MKFSLPILVAGLAIGGAANAAVETFSYSVSATPVPFTKAFTLSSFDTALGALTGIELTINDTTAASVNIFNLNVTPQAFSDASATVPLTVTGPGGVSLLDSVTAGPISGMAGSGLSTFTGLDANNTVSLAIGSGSFSSYETATPQALSFMAAAADGTYNGTGGFGVLFGGSAVASGSVDLAYTYSAPSVPEPAAWTMMIVGFGMMGGVIRRRGGTPTPV